MNYVGLDYHKKYSFATIITEQGEVKEKERLPNRKESFREYLREYKEVMAVVEACWNWPVAIELLEGLVDEVKLAHPLKVKAIAEARIKTDSIDCVPRRPPFLWVKVPRWDFFNRYMGLIHLSA